MLRSRRAAVRLLTMGVTGTGMSSACAHHQNLVRTQADDPKENWHRRRFPDTDAGRVYFWREASGPPVVILHEVLGLTDGCFDLGNRLHREGFTVFLPLLFGNVGGHGFLGGYLRSCGSRQFVCAAADGSSAILPSLQQFCEEASRMAGNRPVGVIGMCLTGAFPISLLRSTNVVAPVICQPTMPFSLVGAGDPAALGLEQGDVRQAIARREVSILGMRFTGDWRCPPQRFTKLRELFGSRFEAIEIPSGLDTVESNAHSVLVGSYKPNGPTHQALLRTVEFLKRRLSPADGALP